MAPTRAELEAAVAELGVGPLLETAHRREARLAELEQAQRQLYEVRTAAAAPRPDPAAESEPGVTPINWGSAREGEVRDVPVRDAIGAHFVKGGIAVADLERWAGEEGPDEAPDMPRAVIADARLAVQTKLPADPIMREKAVEFIEVRRLHNSPAFIEWAAAIGRTVRQELQQAHADRLALAGMSMGSPQYEATKASLDAHYRKAHGGD